MKCLIIALLLLALAGGQGALGERYIVHFPDRERPNDPRAIILSEDGTPLCDPEAYSIIRRLTPADYGEERCLYSARRFSYPINLDTYSDVSYNDVALLDGSGRQVTDFAFFSLDYDPCTDRVIFKRYFDGVFQTGLMRTNGEFIGQWQFDEMVSNGEGGYIGCDSDGRFHYLDDRLVEHDTGLSGWFGFNDAHFSEGLMCLRGQDGQFYINPQGQLAFDTYYHSAEPFHGGWAAVMLEEEGHNCYAFINASGTLLPMRYNMILWSEEDDGYVCAAKSAVDFYHADDGMRVTRIEVETANKWRLDYVTCTRGDIASDGVSREMPRWEDIIGVAVAGEGLYCYDTEGKPMFHLDEAPDFDYIFDYYTILEGTPTALILANSYDSKRLIDRSGNALGPVCRDIEASVWRDGEGRFRYYADQSDEPGFQGEYGVFDAQGRDVLDTVYEKLEVLDLDRFWVRDGDRWGMIDASGRWLYEVSDYTRLLD